jgi:hypothetical protein
VPNSRAVREPRCARRRRSCRDERIEVVERGDDALAELVVGGAQLLPRGQGGDVVPAAQASGAGADALGLRSRALTDDRADLPEHFGHLVVLNGHELLLDVGDLLRALQELLGHGERDLGLLSLEVREDVVREADADGVEEVVDGGLGIHQAPSGDGMG